LKVRKAVVKDAEFIQEIIKKYSVQADLVVKSLADIYTQLRDYFILEDEKGAPAGVIALHVYWENLGEIRSFVILEKYRGKGGGKLLIDAAVSEARSLGLKEIFALTKIPDFFRREGFKDIAKKQLPHKIWKDCFNCPKFPDCDEEAITLKLKKAIK